MTTVALVLGALLAVACIVVVALPFLREPAPERDRLDEPDALERRRLELAEERDRALADLKELEFDHRTGKISDDEYRELVGPMRARATAALRRSDQRIEPKEAGRMEDRIHAEEAPPDAAPEPARVPEPFPPPDEGQPPEPARIPEPFPPPDEGDRPEQPSVPEPGPTGSRER